MEKSLVSVCIITYNHVKYIEQAIDSVLMQQVDFLWEIIIADDYSTDGTRDIILKYKHKFPHLITLILQENNVGAAKNWIDLISKPNSKYIAYLEGDDYWIDQHKLQKQVDFLEKNISHSLCFCHTKKLDQNKQIITYPLKTKELYFHDFLKGNPVGMNSCTALFHSKFLENLNWFLDKPIGDQFLWAKLTNKGRAIILPFYGGVYRIQESGAWSKLNDEECFNKKIEIFTILKSEYSNNYTNRYILNIEEARIIINKKITSKQIRLKDLLIYFIKHKLSIIELWKSRRIFKKYIFYIFSNKRNID